MTFCDSLSRRAHHRCGGKGPPPLLRKASSAGTGRPRWPPAPLGLRVGQAKTGALALCRAERRRAEPHS